MTTKHVTIDSRRVQYREAGSGAPVLLVHAFPLNSAMWEDQLRAVPDGWRFIAPDLRGFGGSVDDAAEGKPRTVEDYAADLVALLGCLGIGSAVIVGLSLGGYVTFAMWRRAPGVFRALVLADTRPQPDTDEGRAGRRRMQDLARSDGTAAIARELVPKLLFEGTRTRQPQAAERVRAMIESARPQAIAGALDALMQRPDSTPLLGELTVPVLVVVGEHDALTPVPLSEAMHAAIPGSRLAIVPDAGHLANLEQPERFNAELVAFLQQLNR